MKTQKRFDNAEVAELSRVVKNLPSRERDVFTADLLEGLLAENFRRVIPNLAGDGGARARFETARIEVQKARERLGRPVGGIRREKSRAVLRAHVDDRAGRIAAFGATILDALLDLGARPEGDAERAVARFMRDVSRLLT